MTRAAPIARAIILRRRRDVPSESGHYVVMRSGCTSPQTAYWNQAERGWRDCGRRLTVEAWEGPVVRPGDVAEVMP